MVTFYILHGHIGKEGAVTLVISPQYCHDDDGDAATATATAATTTTTTTTTATTATTSSIERNLAM